MKVAIAYVFPVVDPTRYRPLARRFVETYMEFPPGESDHDIYVVVNGRADRDALAKLFRPLPCSFLHHDNSGKDIGAFKLAAAQIECDLLVCFGSPVYFRRAGWLDRMLACYEDNGPGLYGAWGFHEPIPYLRTTAFWLPRQVLNSYPYSVTNDTRYEFELGRNCITNHAFHSGLECYMVTWGGCYPVADWHHVTLEQSLFRDQHSDRVGLE